MLTPTHKLSRNHTRNKRNTRGKETRGREKNRRREGEEPEPERHGIAGADIARLVQMSGMESGREVLSDEEFQTVGAAETLQVGRRRWKLQ